MELKIAMSNSQKITLSFLAIIACVLMAVILYSAAQAYLGWTQKPLGPALDYPTPWKLPATWTASPMASQPPPSLVSSTQGAPTQILETETPTSSFLPCTNLPSMTLLAIGVDARSDEYRYGRADVIRAVRVDFRAQRVILLEFPRDLWVRIPEVRDDLGTDRQKLNTAYTYGNPGLHFWDHPSQGPGLLARTLDLNFGLQPDHYIAANMNIFVDIVDALGGLDITLPEAIDGRTSYDRSQRLVFPAGAQHLSGEQALTLARIRNISVFQRAGYQNMVMCALQKEIEKPETVLKIPAIISSFSENIQTDLTPEQISQLACLGTTMPRRNIIFTEFPHELFHNDMVYDPIAKQDVFVWDIDFDILRDYVSQFNTGKWPASSPFATPEPGTSNCE
jgi:LCP family protein required for cell wall assembly